MSEFLADVTATENCPKCRTPVTARGLTTDPQHIVPVFTETRYGCSLRLAVAESIDNPDSDITSAIHLCVPQETYYHPETITLGELQRATAQVSGDKPVYLRTYNDRGVPTDVPLFQVGVAFTEDGFRVVLHTEEDRVVTREADLSAGG